MGDLIDGIEFLNIPMTVAIALVGLFLILQIIGELLEFKGKAVPEFIKVRKYFKRKKDEKEATAQTLKDVQTLLNDVNAHYSADNIAKRDSWMQWVNERAVTYDNFIKEITVKFADVTDALKDNTKMTEDMFVENSRDRIIDFAEKAADYDVLLSREQFRRIDRVYQDYENFLETRGRQNGEVDIAYEAIQDGYKHRLQRHSFLEDIKGYKIK
jgi:hypothetical protein